MKRLLTTIMLCAAGCGGPEAPPAAPDPAAPQEATAPQEELITMKGTEFYLYDMRPESGAVKKPLAVIRADELAVGTGGETSISFKGAHAVLRGQAADAEEIILDAAEGSYEENQRAYLKGGVRAQVADMTLQLEDMEVTTVTPDSPGMAFTEHPVTITAPGMELRAENLRLYPDEKKMELSQCSGFIEFGRLQP